MSAPFIQVERWSDIPLAISRLQATGMGGCLGRAELLQALYQRAIAYDELQRSTPARAIKRFIATARLPSLILLGDDDDAPTGPSGWHQHRRLLRWCSMVIVHAAAGRADEYRMAVAATLAAGRVLMVETTSALAEAWCETADRSPNRPFVHLIAQAGGTHPLPIYPGKMH